MILYDDEEMELFECAEEEIFDMDHPAHVLSGNITRLFMSDMNYVEQLLYLSLVAFTRDGYISDQPSLASVNSMLVEMGDPNGCGIDNALENISNSMAETIPENHIAAELFQVFKGLNKKMQIMTARKLMKRFEVLNE